MDEALRGALLEIGIVLDRKSGTFGSAPKPPNDYITLAIEGLRQQLCPRKQEILARLKSPTADLAVILFDALTPFVGNHIPALASVSRKLAEIGLDRFCAEPEILGEEVGV